MNRMTGLLILEVRDSNPNGDPDRESRPRQREDGRGEISPVSIKRKLRDLVEDKEGPVWLEFSKEFPKEEFAILESRGRDRKDINDELQGDGSRFVRKYWDARLFGNTFLEKDNAGKIRSGTVQFGMGVSIAPITIKELTFTNKSGVQEGKDRGMAPLAFKVVEHAIYTVPFFVNPSAATKSGCTERDVDLMLRILPYAYSHSRSMVRSQVDVVGAHIFQHTNPLGSIADLKFIESLTPKRKVDFSLPSVATNDYEFPSYEDVKAGFNGKGTYRNLVA